MPSGALGPPTVPEWASRPRWRVYARNVIVLALVLTAVTVGTPGPWLSPLGAIVILGLLGVVVGWAIWLFFIADPRRVLAGTATMGLAGVVLILSSPAPSGWLAPAIASLIAGRRVRPTRSITLAGGLVVLVVAGGAAVGLPPVRLAAGTGAIAVGLLIGLARRQADELREKTRLGEEERERAELLAERGRMAREVHDVLAHSLGALMVQLEAADALLEAGRPEQARSSVGRAGQLAREGLAETRRAISALRGDPMPWRRMIAELADAYEGEARATIAPDVPDDLPAEVALALYRSAQEAMTNVRKHAPGAPVDLTVEHTPGEVTLSVVNGPATTRAPRSLPGTGGGYGLTGMRERAELTGGTLAAGPCDQGWSVHVRIPV